MEGGGSPYRGERGSNHGVDLFVGGFRGDVIRKLAVKPYRNGKAGSLCKQSVIIASALTEPVKLPVKADGGQYYCRKPGGSDLA